MLIGKYERGRACKKTDFVLQSGGNLTIVMYFVIYAQYCRLWKLSIVISHENFHPVILIGS